MTDPLAGARLPRPPNRARDALLAGLTPEQAEAVHHGPGPLLIVAGPGTGKTRTLTHRVAHLLATDRAAPREILAVTFSVRAAGELRLRLTDLLGEGPARGVTAATFHSVCARLLREHASVFGRTDAYTIHDQADLRRVIDWLLADRGNTGIREALARCGQPSAAELESEIALAKSRLHTPERYQETARHSARELVAALWRAVEEELRRFNAWSFDDLLVCAVRLHVEHPDRLAHVRARWRWLVVDEMQDTNDAQAALVHLLAGPHGNLTVVGDSDQAIYRFRSAEPRHMLAFGDRYPRHRRIVLGRNFRSRAEILAAAGACIAYNRDRAATTLVSARGRGGRVTTRGFARERDEAAWVAELVADALAAGTAPGEVLVLARTAYATGPTQLALAAAGIPHRILGSLGLYGRAEVRDALAHLALLANPADAQAFRRAVQAPRRGIGAATAARVVASARDDRGGDLIAACAHAHTRRRALERRSRDRLAAFGHGLEAVRAQWRAGRSLACRLIVTLPLRDGGPDVEAVYEDIGEVDTGSFGGLKALYSDARKRAAVAAGIGAYLYTALAPVVLAIGPRPRQVQAIRRPGKSDLLVLSAETEQWLRSGYRARVSSAAAARDLGPILAHGEPEDGMGQGESTDKAAHTGDPTADEPVPTAESEPTADGNGSGELVTVDFGALGPDTPPAA